MSRSCQELELERALSYLIGWPAYGASGTGEQSRHVVREFLHSCFAGKLARHIYDRDDFLRACLRRAKAAIKPRLGTGNVAGWFFTLVEGVLKDRLRTSSFSLYQEYEQSEHLQASNEDMTADEANAPNQCGLEAIRQHICSRGDNRLVELLDALAEPANGRMH